MNSANRLSPRWLILVGLVVLVILVWFLGSSVFVTVPAGHVGVVTTFGKVDDDPLPEGLHVLAPWRKVEKMSVRTQELKEVMDVPTKDGLTVKLDASLLYSLKPDQAPRIYQTVGPDYLQVIVEPQFRSATRGTTVGYGAEALYTEQRTVVEAKLRKDVEDLLSEHGLRTERVLLRSIDLPASVKASIDQKMVADQKQQAMKFELMTAEQEAKKKLIEAKATAEAQETIKKTLDDTYVRYLWVKALETAAQNRSATIYVPTGRDGMPLVGTIPTGSGEKPEK
jgi:regulator of protease activity HflC (stomatin/prohibitin superfamily)